MSSGPLDLATNVPAGTISDIHNDPGSLGTTAQGGFTFTPAPGYTGTVYFYAASLSNEFIPQYFFIDVTANGTSFKTEGDCVSYVNTGK